MQEEPQPSQEMTSNTAVVEYVLLRQNQGCQLWLCSWQHCRMRRRKAHSMLRDTCLLMPLRWRPLKSRKTGRDPFHTVLPTDFRDLRGRRGRGISKRVSHSMGWAFLTSFRRFNGGNCSHKSCRTTTPKIKLLLLLTKLLWNSSVTLVTNHLATGEWTSRHRLICF